MKRTKITQDNVHLLLPNKVAQLADRLLRNGKASGHYSSNFSNPAQED